MTTDPKLLADATAEASELLGTKIAPESVELAARLANELDPSPFVPHATLIYVCELARKLEGEPQLVIAGALIELVKATAKAHTGKKRPKFR